MDRWYYRLTSGIRRLRAIAQNRKAYTDVVFEAAKAEDVPIAPVVCPCNEVAAAAH